MNADVKPAQRSKTQVHEQGGSATALAAYATISGAAAVASAAVVSRLISMVVDDAERLAWLVQVLTALAVSLLAGAVLARRP